MDGNSEVVKGTGSIRTREEVDSLAFRESSLSRVHTELQRKQVTLKGILQTREKGGLQDFLKTSPDEVVRVAVDPSENEDINSSEDTAIMHALGMVIWQKPSHVDRLEAANLDTLTTRFLDGQMDMSRFSKGVYFLEVLLHKYKNGNGRAARGMKLVLDKSTGDEQISEDETRQVLGLERESLTRTGVDTDGKETFRINFNPDFERLVLGTAYFGLHKGLTQEQVVGEMKLNGVMPEAGLATLSQKLGEPKDKLKEEFISFMVADSDLKWCDFGKQ